MSQQVEKTITWLLRHGAVEEKVPMNEEGFVEIINLIQWLKKKNINLKLDDINKIVAADKKSRYLLKDNMIIASSEAGTALKHNYFQFNMLHLMKNHLTELEFNQIIKLIFPVVDSKETKQSDDIDFNQPFRFKKSKNENKNPWNRY